MTKYHGTTVRFSGQARDAIGRLKQQSGHRSMSALLEHLVMKEAKQQGCWIPKAVNLLAVRRD